MQKNETIIKGESPLREERRPPNDRSKSLYSKFPYREVPFLLSVVK